MLKIQYMLHDYLYLFLSENVDVEVDVDVNIAIDIVIAIDINIDISIDAYPISNPQTEFDMNATTTPTPNPTTNTTPTPNTTPNRNTNTQRKASPTTSSPNAYLPTTMEKKKKKRGVRKSHPIPFCPIPSHLLPPIHSPAHKTNLHPSQHPIRSIPSRHLHFTYQRIMTSKKESKKNNSFTQFHSISYLSYPTLLYTTLLPNPPP